MKYTKVYKLKLPDLEDYILVGDLNGNFEIIDAELKKIADGLANIDWSILDTKADLGEDGKVLASQLPEIEKYNEILFYDARGNFPAVGDLEKLYINKQLGMIYRWTGTSYVEVSKGVDLGETSTTAYRGDRGKIAYDHSQSSHLKLGESSTTAYRGDFGKIAYDHSQSAHAPTDVYTRAQVDELLKALESKIRKELESDILEKILLYS